MWDQADMNPNQISVWANHSYLFLNLNFKVFYEKICSLFSEGVFIDEF